MCVRQILKVYRSATADEIQHGMKWYAIAKRDSTAKVCVHDFGARPKSIAALHSVFPMGSRTANKTTIRDKNGSSCQSVKIPLTIVISDIPNRGSSPALINGENQEIG